MAFITSVSINQKAHQRNNTLCDHRLRMKTTNGCKTTTSIRMTVSTQVPSLHIETPLIKSSSSFFHATSESDVPPVLLKMDNMQPGGSFKIRGHGHLLATHASKGKTRFISSSGGNAGMAVSIAASHLKVSATIVVPSTTPLFMQSRLRQAGAEVIVHGNVWNEADMHAQSLVSSDPQSVYVSPFDDELLWEGHASLVRELVKQCNGQKPGKIVVSVGGGGLLLGIVHGLRQVDWLKDVEVIAAETEGAESFAKMVQHGKIVQLPGITSIAKSLGALAVSEKCLDLIQDGECNVKSVVVSDKDAVEACSALAVQHRVLVEPACGAAVAAAKKVLHDGSNEDKRPIVVVVCGGSMTSPALLADWIRLTGATEQELS